MIIASAAETEGVKLVFTEAGWPVPESGTVVNLLGSEPVKPGSSFYTVIVTYDIPDVVPDQVEIHIPEDTFAAAEAWLNAMLSKYEDFCRPGLLSLEQLVRLRDIKAGVLAGEFAEKGALVRLVVHFPLPTESVDRSA